MIVCALIVVAGGVWAIDSAVNGSRIYQGISIGEVDVSGMTEQEARQAISACYEPRLDEAKALIFPSEEVRDSFSKEAAACEEDADARGSLIEDARAEGRVWTADARSLGARVPVSDLVEQAFEVGRDGRLLERVGAATEGLAIPVTLLFDDAALEALCSSLDAQAGDSRIDFDIAIEDGTVSVTEGRDGVAVDERAVTEQLARGFLSDRSAELSIVAEAQLVGVRITEEEANRVAAIVQSSLDDGLDLKFEQTDWKLGAADLGPWVRTRVEQQGESFRLVPYLDESIASKAVLSLIRDAGYVSAATVSFAKEDGEVWVHAQEGSRYPYASDAVRAAEAALFGNGERAVTVGWGDAPRCSTFDDALSIGLIGEISSFTTEYLDAPSTASRRHNIHRAADLLNDSVASGNGGEWSFNATVGEANEASGFRSAGAIINGEFDDAIGGGICQVATTVFNAVYEAGYPVTERRNHSLYISTYPTGRDAAIAYPDLDLTWVNDGTSDVLVRSRYTDSSLTVTLYGVDPGYVVTSQTGDWQPGEAFKQRTKVDESEPEGTRYVKTAGADGRCIVVHRTVRDRAGNVVREEDFSSNYAPVDELTIVGPNTPLETDDEKEEASVLSTGN